MECRKTTYPDKKAAQSARNAVLKRKRNRPKDLRIYRCEHCHGWHLTKQFSDE